MAAKKTNLKEAPSREERLNSLLLQYADLQQEEAGIKKAKDFLRAEIESLFPPIPAGEKEVKFEAEGVIAKVYYPETTVVDPEKLWDQDEYRDHFWRLVKVPLTEARAILPGDVLHSISRVEKSPVAQLLIRRSTNKEDR
jgi:hypothetical protein